jgi:hypothetical protein
LRLYRCEARKASASASERGRRDVAVARVDQTVDRVAEQPGVCQPEQVRLVARPSSPLDEDAEDRAEQRVHHDLVGRDTRTPNERWPITGAAVRVDPIDNGKRRPQREVLELRRGYAGLDAPQPSPLEDPAERRAVREVKSEPSRRPGTAARDEASEQPNVRVRRAKEPREDGLRRSPGPCCNDACSGASQSGTVLSWVGLVVSRVTFEPSRSQSEV